MDLIKKFTAFNMALIWHFFTYISGAIGMKALGAITFAYIVAHMSPHDLGVLTLAQTAMALAPAVVSLGLRQACIVEYFHVPIQERMALVSRTISTYLSTATIIVCIGVPLLPFILHNTFLAIAVAIAAYSYVHFFTELFIYLLRLEQRAQAATFWQLVQSVIQFVWIVGWIQYQTITPLMFIIGSLTAMSAIAFYAGMQWRSVVILRPMIDTQLLRLGVPYVGTIVLNWSAVSAGKWLLGYYSLTSVGLLAIAFTISQLFQAIIVQPATYSYLPHQLRTWGDPAIKKLNWLFFKFILIGGSLFLIGAHFMFYFVGQHILPLAYHPGIVYIAPLLITDIFALAALCTTVPYTHAKRMDVLFYFHVITAFISVGLNFVLIPLIGTWGLIIATVLSQMVFVLMQYAWVDRIEHRSSASN